MANSNGHSRGSSPDTLSNSLKSRHLTMMSIAGVIGGSLFVGSATIIHNAGPAAALAYFLGGIVVVLVMRMLGEMATSYPDTGSFSIYADRAIGRWAGFTIGWLYWAYWALLMAWEAYAAGTILHGWIPGVSVNSFTLATTLLLISLNFFNVKNYGEFEFWFALVKVVAIICFLTVATLAVLHIWPLGHTNGLANITQHGGFMPNGIKAVVVALLGVMFGFLGVEIVTIAAAESKDPAKEIKKATNSVVWRVCLFYIGSIFLVAAVVPWNDPLLGQSGYGAYRRALELLGIPGAQWVMNFVVLTSVSSCMISAHYTASRMLFSLAQRGDAPAAFRRTRGNTGIPVNAVIGSCSVAIVMGIINFIEALRPKDVLDLLMNVTGMVAMLVYLVIALSQLNLRRKLDAEGRRSSLRMWLQPWLSLTVVVFLVGSLIAMLFVDECREIVMSTGLAAGAVVVIGLFVHARAHRQSKPGRTGAAGRSALSGD